MNDSGVDILDLPSARLPWTAVATLLRFARLPLDYNRRWTILLNRARGVGTSLLDCAPETIPGSQSSSGGGVGSGSGGGGGMSAKERKLQLLERLQEG